MKFFQKKKEPQWFCWFKEKPKRFAAVITVSVSVAILAFVLSATLAPRNFPASRVVTIPEGATLEDVAQLFNERKVIASPFFFNVIMKLSSWMCTCP